MKEFIFGMLFMAIALPIINGLVNIWNQAVECICAFFAVKVCKYNKEVQDLEGDEEEPHNPIGFCLPANTIDRDDDDEDE